MSTKPTRECEFFRLTLTLDSFTLSQKLCCSCNAEVDGLFLCRLDIRKYCHIIRFAFKREVDESTGAEVANKGSWLSANID